MLKYNYVILPALLVRAQNSRAHKEGILFKANNKTIATIRLPIDYTNPSALNKS